MSQLPSPRAGEGPGDQSPQPMRDARWYSRPPIPDHQPKEPCTAQPSTPPLYPLFLNLQDRRVLVVGGGEVAARKALPLIESGARVIVGAPELNDALQSLKTQGHIEHLEGEFQPHRLDEVFLAIAATDGREVNRAVAEEGAARRLWVNVVDDTELTRVQVPAVVRHGPLTVAISSGGAAPVLARQLRARFPHVPSRRKFMDSLWPGDVGELLRAARFDAARARLIEPIESGEPEGSLRGFVSLVGAGPVDPGLLTLKGQRRLQEADVILHDRLVSREVLALGRRDAQFIEVAKEAGTNHTTQDGIHALLFEHAHLGKRVVRLKGGDPFIFGRGGEELEFLRAHSTRYEVVPGITAALACAAHAGIPLTHCDHAQSVRFVTAHCRSRPEQRVIHCILATLPDVAKREAVKSPALLILGEVAALGEKLTWFGENTSLERPARKQAARFAAVPLMLDARA